MQLEVDDELRFHLDTRAEELTRRGMSPDEARAQAAREFGDIGAARTELAAIDRRRAARASSGSWQYGTSPSRGAISAFAVRQSAFIRVRNKRL